MELIAVRLAESPSARGKVRLVGDVVYEDRPGVVEQYWFEVPEKYADSLSLSGDPWLACLLPLAATRGEPLRLCAPVDPVLLANAPRLMRTWSEWYRRRFPGIRAVPIYAGTKLSTADPGPRRTAAFFSGGVDSFFTVLRNAEPGHRNAAPAIDRLLCVWGFDIPLRVPEEFERLRSRLSEAAAELGKELLDVATNLREVRFREARWGHVSHGCAMASIGLALGPAFHTFYIAATHSDGPLRPWGSHPETDPLLSTSVTRFIHDGPGIPRSEKTEFLSRSAVAMRSLHVCYRINSSENCCDCRKCLLAMLNLEVLGALSRCATFRRRSLDLERVKRVYVRSPAYERLYGDIEARARAAGRSDVADAIAACLSRSRRLKPLIVVLQWLSTKRGVWRVARRWRSKVLASSAR
jgi:hypothetical protein